jgi:hypothetical protein
VIQSSVTILKEIVGKSIWSKNVNNVFYRTAPFPSYALFTFVPLLLLCCQFL